MLSLFFTGSQQVTADNPEVAQLAAASENTWTHPPLDWKVEEEQYHQIRSLIAGRKVQTGADYLRAEVIVERRITPDDQLLAHVLALDSLALGNPDARWIAAESLDHYLHSVGSRQIFGTQFAFKDPAKPRVRVETEPGFVSDPLRKRLCVAPLDGPGAAPETLETGTSIHSLALRDCPATAGTADNPKATALYTEDQADRENPPADWRVVAARDQHRRELARQMINTGALHTGNDFYHVAMLYQHGSEPGDYLFAHTLAMVAMAYGCKDARWLAAATFDRYLRSVWRAQVFGTQYLQQPWQSQLTLSPTDPDLVSDSARATLCVLPMSGRDPQTGASGFSSTNICR